jgi:hypothetical protein
MTEAVDLDLDCPGWSDHGPESAGPTGLTVFLRVSALYRTAPTLPQATANWYWLAFTVQSA